MTNSARPTLGTQLRHLLELLDGDVDAIYDEEGLDYRSRFTPILQTLSEKNGLAIRDLAKAAHITHSAACQTLAKMKRAGLVVQSTGLDSREQLISLSSKARRMLPRLKQRWSATNAAASALDRELPVPLSELIEAAIRALERKPFRERIRSGRNR